MSTIKKETKTPALLKLPIYSTELAAVIFLKSTMLNAQKHLQRSHSFIVNVSTEAVAFLFYLGFLLRKFTIHRTAGEGGGFLFNSSVPLLPALQTLKHKRNGYGRELASAPLTYMPSQLQLFIKYRTFSE